MSENRILLIGELNAPTKDIRNCIEEYFSVQVCDIIPSVVEGMMRFENPRLVIINLIGQGEELDEIYHLLDTLYPSVDVITVGNTNEYEPYADYYKSERFVHLMRPLKSYDILLACSEKMGFQVNYLKRRKKQSPQINTWLNEKDILVVDDSKIQLRNVKQWLEGKYKVRLAASAEQAMTQIYKSKPDLILLDYDMPECNGKEFFEKLSSTDGLNTIPVVFLTGVDDRDHINEVLRLVPAGYLLKPVAYNKLMEVLREVLGEI